MLEILRLFFEICLLKKGPQDVPRSGFLFWLALFSYSAVGMIMLRLSTGWLNSLMQLMAGLIFLLAFTIILLMLKSKIDRFWQVVTALLGTDALISFVALPVIGSLSADGSQPVFELAYIGLIFWSWLVMGHIFRHALSATLLFGLSMAFLYFFGTLQLMALLFPELIDVTGG